MLVRKMEVQPEALLRTPLFGVGFDACRTVGTFGIFQQQKRVSKSGTVHASVDAVEQARTCVGSSAAMLQEFESWL